MKLTFEILFATVALAILTVLLMASRGYLTGETMRDSYYECVERQGKEAEGYCRAVHGDREPAPSKYPKAGEDNV